MDEKELAELVQSPLHELNRPARDLSSICLDFDQCGIDYAYAIIGSLAVRCHHYLTYGDDVHVLVSAETFSR